MELPAKVAESCMYETLGLIESGSQHRTYHVAIMPNINDSIGDTIEPSVGILSRVFLRRLCQECRLFTQYSTAVSAY